MKVLGTAAAFPLRPDGRGGIATVTGVEAVEDSIRAIIETMKGSHLFNPFLGLPPFVFQPMQDLAAVSEVIKDALIWGDDRIDPDTLFVEVGIEDSGFTPISITYSVRGDATERSLVHGFRIL
jgi:hypothetical protein